MGCQEFKEVLYRSAVWNFGGVVVVHTVEVGLSWLLLSRWDCPGSYCRGNLWSLSHNEHWLCPVRICSLYDDSWCPGNKSGGAPNSYRRSCLSVLCLLYRAKLASALLPYSPVPDSFPEPYCPMPY